MKGEIQRTKGKLKRKQAEHQGKAKEETRWRLKEYDSVSIENDERKPGKRSKKTTTTRA